MDMRNTYPLCGARLHGRFAAAAFAAAALFVTGGAPALAQPCAWATKAPLPIAREGSSAGVINGKLYVVGGTDNSGAGSIVTCDAYNPTTDSWEPVTSSPLAFSDAGAAVIDNKLYVVHFGALYVFDPALPVNDQWQEKATPPLPHWFSQAAVGAIGGKLYVAGGTAGVEETYTSKRCLEYDPGTDTWAVKTSMQFAREACTSAVYNGKLYVFGGLETMTLGGFPVMEKSTRSDAPGDGFHVGTCEVYDPATDSWTEIANLPDIAGVPQYRMWATAQVLKSKIYLAGGENSGSVTESTCLEYDVANNTWAVVPHSLSVARRAPVSGVINGRMYVVGGYDHYTPGAFYDANEELLEDCVPVTLSSFSAD